MLLRLNAEMRRLNWAFDVPISRDSRDLSGPRKYDPLSAGGQLELGAAV